MAHLSAEMQRCIQECQSCHAICIATVTHCLEMGGKHAAPDHIRTLIDCAQICQTSADFMLRGSQYHTRTCGACAEVCEACAAECEQMGSEQFMQQCAHACRRCADSCRQMAGAHAH